MSVTNPAALLASPGLIDDYLPLPDSYDEMRPAAGEVRPQWRYALEVSRTLGARGDRGALARDGTDVSRQRFFSARRRCHPGSRSSPVQDGQTTRSRRAHLAGVRTYDHLARRALDRPHLVQQVGVAVENGVDHRSGRSGVDRTSVRLRPCGSPRRRCRAEARPTGRRRIDLLREGTHLAQHTLRLRDIQDGFSAGRAEITGDIRRGEALRG
jgi:hypothetical protein